MSARELIESGIIELYVLGLASEEERRCVEQLAAAEPSVQQEMAQVSDALARFALASVANAPGPSLKEKIIVRLQAANAAMPPQLTRHSTPDEWRQYLLENHLHEPEQMQGIHFLELPSTESCYTYAVWGNRGDVVDTEVHDGHQESLLICSGECEMTIGGNTAKYRAGDFLEIKSGIPHSALITGKELMLVIGQRKAA